MGCKQSVVRLPLLVLLLNRAEIEFDLATEIGRDSSVGRQRQNCVDAVLVRVVNGPESLRS
jgi:hypothetical protein